MSYLFKYYSKQYDGFMKLFKLDKNDFIIKKLGDITNLKVLDIGGGTGTLASRLMDLGAEVTILDPEKRMTDIAIKKNLNVKVVNAFSGSIPLDDSNFDLVIMRDAFHHIMDKEKTLEECSRVLKSNGRLAICEFDKKHLVSKLIAAFEKACFEKIKMVSKEELKELTAIYFKKYQIISNSSYEFIYIGEKSYE